MNNYEPARIENNKFLLYFNNKVLNKGIKMKVKFLVILINLIPGAYFNCYT